MTTAPGPTQGSTSATTSALRFRRTTRVLPGTKWVSVFVSPIAEPGHAWMHGGLVRRDGWRLPGWAPGRLSGLVLGVLVMPERNDPANYTGARLAVHEKAYGPRPSRRLPASAR